MSAAWLKITNGTDNVDLLRGPFFLSDQIPGWPALKGGGIFIDSPFTSGRRLAYSVRENAIDRYDFMIKADDGDDADDYLNNLVTLLDQAARHWKTNGRVSPVWIEERSPQHTSIKYARIVVGSIQGMGNKFAQPYLQNSCAVLENELILLVERENWKSVTPGTVETLTVVDNVYPSNFIYNASFEYPLTGSVYKPTWKEVNSPDSVAQSDVRVQDGLVSVRIVDSGSDGGIYQNIQGLDSASPVTITVYVYVVSGTAQLEVFDGGGFSNGVSDSTATTGSWIQLSVTKTVPSTSDIRIALTAEGGTADVYFDNAEGISTYGPATGQTSEKVYFSNGVVSHSITHVDYWEDPSAFGGNLLETSLPYDLGPASLTVGDYFLFGSCGFSNAGGGPFSHVVLDIATACDATLTWEYYAFVAPVAASWTALDGVVGGFTETGEQVISWPVPINWTSVAHGDPSSSMFWVRARVTNVGSGNPPEVQTFHPYTNPSSFVEISGSLLSGDVNPPIRLTITPEAAPIKLAAFEYLTSNLDDADWDDAVGMGSGTRTNSTVQMAADTTIMFRFSDVGIPQGAIITEARIAAISAGGTGVVVANYDLRVELADDAAAFTEGMDYSSRSFDGDTSILWSINPYPWIADSGGSYFMPSVKDQVQAVVDRSGWASGNAMAFKLTDDVIFSAEYRTFSMYDNNSESWFMEVSWVDRQGFTSNIIIGARSTDRGEDFRSAINMSSFSYDAISVTPGVNSTFSEDLFQATLTDGARQLRGSAVKVSISGEDGSLKDRAVVQIPPDMSKSYSGSFRAFARVIHDGTLTISEATSFRLRLGIGGESTFSPVSSTATLQYPELVDFGTITIPDLSTSGHGLITLAIQATRGPGTNQSIDFYLHDLILIPSDEWICELRAPRSSTSVLTGDRTLIVDGVDAVNGLSAEVVKENSRIRWSTSGAPLRLEKNQTTRLWFLTMSDLTIDNASQGLGGKLASFSGHVHSVTAEYVREFLLGRGSA